MAHYWSMLGRTIVTLHSLLFDILVKEWLEKSVSRDGTQMKKRTQHVDTIMLMATRNPAHQLRLGVFSKYLQGFIHPRWLAGFLNHQQYHVDSVC